MIGQMMDIRLCLELVEISPAPRFQVIKRCKNPTLRTECPLNTTVIQYEAKPPQPALTSTKSEAAFGRHVCGKNEGLNMMF